MKKLFYQVLDFLLFSNIFIALCAVAQALVTYQLLRAEPDIHVLAVMFCSTLAVYNFSILSAKPKNPQSSLFKRVRWIFSHHRLITTLLIIAVLSLIPLFLFLSLRAQILLFFLGVISIAYSLPVFSVADKKFGLRNIPGLKLFLIALTWALSCVLLPILELESRGALIVSTRDTLLLIVKRFLFIAAITVPFDIRDMFQDKANDLKTIPVMLGERKAYYFCSALLAVYVVLLIMFNTSGGSGFIGLALTILTTSWLIFKSDRERNEYYYFFYLDGTMILQYIVLLAGSFIDL